MKKAPKVLVLLAVCTVFTQCAKGKNAAETPRQMVSPSPTAAGTPVSTPEPSPVTEPTASPLPKPTTKITFTDVHVDGPYIAMTFDDGPHATNTPKLLDFAAKRHIKLTFFLVGQCAAEYPQLVRREVAEGHEVANHSWSHPNLAKLSEERVRSELQKTQDAIEQACGISPKLMRPPYGEFTQKQRLWAHGEWGFRIILWDVDPLDWKRPGPSVVASRIIAGARSGSIILAHDIHGPSVDAMPEVFDTLLAKGFKFVTVSELLAMDKGGPRPELVKPKPAEETAKKAPSPATPSTSPLKVKAR